MHGPVGLGEDCLEPLRLFARISVASQSFDDDVLRWKCDKIVAQLGYIGQLELIRRSGVVALVPGLWGSGRQDHV